MAGYGDGPYGLTPYGGPAPIGAVLPAGLGPVTGQLAVTAPVQIRAARRWLLLNIGPDPVVVFGDASWVGLILPRSGQITLPPVAVTVSCAGTATVSLYAN